MVNDMKIRVAMALAVVLAAIVASGCGSDVSGVSDQGNSAGLAAGTSRVIFSGGGVLEQRGGTSGSGSAGKGIAGLKSVYNDASTVCLFETPTSTSSGIQIVTSDAPSDSSCTNKNSCILCTLGATTPVADCSISCTGTVPSTTATAADSVPIFVTISSMLHTNAPSATGMVRYDVYSDNWPEFSMSNFPVSTDFTGCDGTAASYEVGLNTGAVVYDYPYWTATHQVNGYAINALNPDSSTTPTNQSTCTASFQYYAAMSLAGADVPGTTIDFSGKGLVFRATMCNTADATNSDPGADAATCKPRTAPLLLLHLDELLGATSFTDSSSNALNGACGQSCPTAGGAGKYGNALSFNGSGNAVAMGSSAVLKPAHFTIGAWFNVASGQAVGWHTIYRWRMYGVGLGLSNAKLQVFVYTSTAPSYSVTTTGTYDDGTWHHVAATFDGTTLALYVDGSFTLSTPATGSVYYGSGGAGIGRDGDYNGSYFTGLIDDFALYDVALSPEEITSIFHSTTAIP